MCRLTCISLFYLFVAIQYAVFESTLLNYASACLNWNFHIYTRTYVYISKCPNPDNWMRNYCTFNFGYMGKISVYGYSHSGSITGCISMLCYVLEQDT